MREFLDHTDSPSESPPSAQSDAGDGASTHYFGDVLILEVPSVHKADAIHMAAQNHADVLNFFKMVSRHLPAIDSHDAWRPTIDSQD
jgi:hypothetical protein